jgi:hypothetical protein
MNCQGLEAWQAQTLSIRSVSLNIKVGSTFYPFYADNTHTTIENMSIMSQFFLQWFQRNSEIAKKTFMFHCLSNILLFTQCNWQQYFPVLKFENLTSINKCNKLFNEVQILREEFKSRFQDTVENVKHHSTHLHLHLKQKLWHPN